MNPDFLSLVMIIRGHGNLGICSYLSAYLYVSVHSFVMFWGYKVCIMNSSHMHDSSVPKDQGPVVQNKRRR